MRTKKSSVCKGDHLLLDEKIAASSTPSNRLAASPKLFPASQSATDYANRLTTDLPESKSGDRRLASAWSPRHASLTRRHSDSQPCKAAIRVFGSSA
jgi:hypothetical protein